MSRVGESTLLLRKSMPGVFVAQMLLVTSLPVAEYRASLASFSVDSQLEMSIVQS